MDNDASQNKNIQIVYDIISKTPSVTFVWKNQAHWPVEFVGKNVESLLGYTVEDFISGRVHYASLIHPDDAETVANEVVAAAGDPKFESFRHLPYRLITKDKNIIYVDDMTYIRRNSKGEVTHFEGVILDVTNQLHSQKEKEDHRERLFLNSKLASIGIFAAGMAHEINNPLMIIKGANDILKSKLPDSSPQDLDFLLELVEKQSRGVERILEIVSGLTTYSRAPDQEAVIDLNQLVQTVTSFTEALFASKGIELDIRTSPNPIRIQGNSGKVEQALVNVLTNARDAVNEVDGKISISTEASSQDFSVITVKDNGSGISNTAKAHIFDMFYTTKPPGKGTGLGLGITRTIVEELGGTIDFSSSDDEGTTFTIQLPRVS